jgi:hypothetical protein
MKAIVIFLLVVHGCLHLLGFIKAFDLATLDQLSAGVSRPVGILWLATAIAFLAAALLYWMGNDGWRIVALFAVIVSESLIIASWQDARYGTIANAILLLATTVSSTHWSMLQR